MECNAQRGPDWPPLCSAAACRGLLCATVVSPPPQDILANIKGMSSGIRHPLRRTAAEALLARGPPEFDAGPGRIESSLGDMGPILPVVCGDAGVRVTPNE